MHTFFESLSILANAHFSLLEIQCLSEKMEVLVTIEMHNMQYHDLSSWIISIDSALRNTVDRELFAMVGGSILTGLFWEMG